jgi:hypothetical protein
MFNAKIMFGISFYFLDRKKNPPQTYLIALVDRLMCHRLLCWCLRDKVGGKCTLLWILDDHSPVSKMTITITSITITTPNVAQLEWPCRSNLTTLYTIKIPLHLWQANTVAKLYRSTFWQPCTAIFSQNRTRLTDDVMTTMWKGKAKRMKRTTC